MSDIVFRNHLLQRPILPITLHASVSWIGVGAVRGGTDVMVLNDKLAQAIDAIRSPLRPELVGVLRSTSDLRIQETNSFPSNPVISDDHSPEKSRDLREVMFGNFSRKKILCQCGAIADIDLAVVRLKHKLGKEVECMTCRNQRIARELEALDAHFTNPEEEQW